jgi:hypothetical protein
MAKEFSLEEALGTKKQTANEFSLEEALGKKPERTYGEAATDIGAKFVSGLGSLIQQPGQLYGLATGAIKEKDFGTTGAQGIGQEMQEWAKEHTSKALLAKEAETARKAQEAEKTGGQWAAFKAQAGAMLSDPAQLTAFLAEQTPQAIPSIIAALIPGAGPGVAAELRAAQVAAKSATTVAAKEAAEAAVASAVQKATASQVARGAAAAKGVGAVQQGADIGAGAYEDIYKKLIEGGASEPEAADKAINLARAAGVGGGALSLLAAKLPGAQAFERALAGEKIGAKGILGKAAAIGAGALKEIPGEQFEEVGGKALQNLAMRQVNPEQSLTEGLGITAAQAAIGAAGMGGVGGALSGRQPEAAARTTTTTAERSQPEIAPTPEMMQAQLAEQKAVELEMQQNKQRAAMDRSAENMMGGAGQANQELLTQARIRKEQQERAAAAEEKAAEAERKKALRAERVRIAGTQYSSDPALNEVLRTKAIAEFDAANAPKVEAPKIPEFQPTKTIEQTTPIAQPEGINILRGMESRNADLMSAIGERRAAEQATAEAKARTAEVKKAEETKKAEVSRADVDQRVAQVENFLMSPAKKTQQETADYMAGVVPEMQKDFLALLDEDMSQPLTPEQTKALKDQIRQRLQPEVAAEEDVQRTPFKRFLASKGMNTKDVQDIFGENAYRANQQLPGSVRATGPRLDMLAEAAVQEGFLKEEDVDQLVQMIKDEFGGEQQTPVGMADERAASEYEAERENEVMSRAGVIGLDTKGMTVDEVATRLDRIERQREVKRKQYSKDVDGFADLPTAEQDRIIDVMTDRFGEPQVFDVERAEQEGQIVREKGLPPEGPATETLEAKTEKGGWKIEPEEQRIERELTGKNFMQVAQWAVDSAPNAFYRTIAEKVQSRLREYQRKGVEFDFKLHTGTTRSSGMRGRAGAVEFTWERQGSTKGSKMEMHLNGAASINNQSGYAPGVQYDTILHELLHAALRTQTRFLPETDQLYKDLMELNNKVIAAFNKQAKEGALPPVMMDYYRRENNVLATPDELISWGMTDKGVQNWLDTIKVGEKSVLTKLVELMRKVLGLGKPYESAFEKLVRTTDSLLDVDVGSIEGNMMDAGFGMGVAKKATSTSKPVQQTLFREVTSKKTEARTPNEIGQKSLDIMSSTGMQLPPVAPGQIERLKAAAKSAVEDPALTSASAKKAIVKFLDKMEVAAFSGDAAFNNDIRRNLIADLNEHPEVMGMLLEASQSQAVHSDALASQFIIDGGIAYDPEAKKWVSVKKEDNFIVLAKKIDKVANKYGLTKEQAERVAHTYFVAKRFKSLLAKQRGRESEIARLEDELASENANIKRYIEENDYEKANTSERAKNDIKSEIKKLKEAEVKIDASQIAMIEPGMSLAENMPELKDISDTWQAIRSSAARAMVDGGLWSMKQSEEMLDNIDYVPFYREEQLEEGGGPQEFVKGLEVKAQEYRLKGSGSPVNDVFDNMVRWTQYAINRSVRNHKALQMVDIGTKLQVGDGKMAEKVGKMDSKQNTIRVFRNGKQEIYKMADPLYVDAFSSISNVTIPSLKFFTWFSNLLRESVVLYPLFSVAQVPQDAISAMFSSGLKPQYALRIPVMAVKEFIKTLNKSSATHNLLKSYGATGVRDFSAAVARKDIEIAAGLKAEKGLGGRIKEGLSHIAMAADNSVRQAVYDASVAQGLSKAEALEKSFDIINFRRRGTSKMINLMGQVVPFFYAYMSVQRTAYKTITGVGISPQKRSEAMKTLAATSGAVMALALFYTMMNAGDDEYEKTPTAVRDRTLNIPGTGGMRIPLRPDLFLFPKVITEHLYHMITDDGLSDGAKFRKSVADGMANAVLSPQPIPQAIKPAFEVAINYDFFQGRPLIGQFEKQKEAERQFNDNTSEFSKMLGQFGVSPIAADHVIRGMFGSAGGLFLYGTNFMLNSDPDVPRPELSLRDAMAALPGTSGFVTKASENALKNDFFALRDEVEKTKNTYNDIKMRSPQELEQFLSDEKNIARLGLAKGTEKIGMQLSKIRRAITQITNAPSDLYSASEKTSAIKELRQVEKDMLKSIDLGEMRKQAQL